MNLQMLTSKTATTKRRRNYLLGVTFHASDRKEKCVSSLLTTGKYILCDYPGDACLGTDNAAFSLILLLAKLLRVLAPSCVYRDGYKSSHFVVLL